VNVGELDTREVVAPSQSDIRRSRNLEDGCSEVG
jgi:hypothetical protein